MKKISTLLLVLGMLVSVMSCGLSTEDVDAIADEVVGRVMDPVNDLTHSTALTYGMSVQSMVSWSTNQYGKTIEFQTNDQNGLSFADGWLNVKAEGSAKISSNNTELAYGYVNVDVNVQVKTNGTVMNLPGTVAGYTNFNLPTPSNSVSFSLSGTTHFETRGMSMYVPNPFSYTIQAGNSKSDPLTFSINNIYSTDLSLQLKGLLAISKTTSDVVGAISYNFDLTITMNQTTGEPAFSGNVTGTVDYNGKSVDYTMTVLDSTTVEITIQGKTVQKKLSAIASMMH